MNLDNPRGGDLGQRFQQLFDLAPALDAQSIDQVYRIRHDVYCRDLGWEAVRPDGRETDAFDAHSWHCLLRRRDTGEAVGCTRLVVPRADDPDAPLPFEDTCRDSLDRSVTDPSRMERRSLGEVSRLAVVNTFRRRKGESAVPIPTGESDFTPLHEGERERFPFIPVSLYLGAAATARRVGVEYVFVLTEPRLARHFERIGFDIHPVGRPVEHRGLRVPSVLSMTKLVQTLRPTIRPLYEVIEASVERAFRAAGVPPVQG
jgi:N-acyl amino acid synthase of PEP-CTERM/exosortase system